MGYPFSFIHIGLPKCASTYMQAIWHKDSNYKLGYPDQIVQLVTTLVQEGTNNPGPGINVPEEARQEDGTYRVVSSEGFSWGFVNQPDLQIHMDDLHRVSARVLGRAELTDTIFIMVRNPVDMVRALHEQSIKQGGTESFTDFCQNQRRFVLGPLNLALILAEYRRYFARIVVLASDQLRRDPEKFWEAYANDLDVPGPSRMTQEMCLKNTFTNRSLKERVAALAKLNEYNNRLMGVFYDLPGYREDHPKESRNFRIFYDENWVWLSRRVAEYATDEQLQGLLDLLRVDVAGSFQEIRLDPELAGEIEAIYLRPLEEHGLVAPELIDEYRGSLARATAG